VFGSVRRQSDAERLQQEFGGGFTALMMDVTDRSTVERAANDVERQLGSETLAGLVNNAGVAVPGPLLYVPLQEFRRQMEVNLTAQLSVTQVFAPLLGADSRRQGPKGRVVNITSVGGKIGVPFLGAYVASKHALEGLSEVLRRELMLFGIDVVLVGPGSVATAIWDKGAAEDLSMYDATPYRAPLQRLRQYMIEEGRRGLAPEVLGEVVFDALTARRPKVRYAVVPQKLKNWTLPRLLPKRLIDRLIAKQVGLLP
jgi:NAD(P)-dependent dehydrogenase (short-subunit alcohol dehydrogenase family)